jgi:hypothetical protein
MLQCAHASSASTDDSERFDPSDSVSAYTKFSLQNRHMWHTLSDSPTDSARQRSAVQWPQADRTASLTDACVTTPKCESRQHVRYRYQRSLQWWLLAFSC